jgi:GDPmannose 4,6-dehydratase
MAQDKVALITGITGQDGAYLSKLLLSKGYRVIGAYRRSSSANFWRLDELDIMQHPKLKLVCSEITDLGAMLRLLKEHQPTEVYNLAAQSFVGASFDQPILTTNVNAIGALNILEAIRISRRDIRFYQASTSEMFGKVVETPQTEMTPFYPRSPYGTSKLFSHWSAVNYRESYGLFCASGILFNHESPLRGMEFVTRKITSSLARISLDLLDVLEIGNLDAKRDWGCAEDYVEGMWLMLQQAEPDDYVLATGCATSVRDFILMASSCLGMDLYFEGEGVNELGIDRRTGRIRIKVNKTFFRPTEVDILLGDASKARDKIGWKPTVTVEKLCELMTLADLERLTRSMSA